MKNTILTLAAALVLFTSCTKEDELQPVVTPIPPVVIVTPPVLCLDTSGTIISMMHDMTNGVDNIDSYLTLSTSCDTVEVLRVHSLDTIYRKGMIVFFDRNEFNN